MKLIESIRNWFRKRDDYTGAGVESNEELFQRSAKQEEDRSIRIEARRWTVKQMKKTDTSLDEKMLRDLLTSCYCICMLPEKNIISLHCFVFSRPLEILRVFEKYLEKKIIRAAEKAQEEAMNQMDAMEKKLHCLDYAFGTPELERTLKEEARQKRVLNEAVKFASAAKEVLTAVQFQVKLTEIAVKRVNTKHKEQ